MSKGNDHKDVLLIAYGSMMSGYGLQSLHRLHVRAAARVALRNARRGFAKYSQRGDRFAMALEPIDTSAPIAAQARAVGDPADQLPEGLLLRLPGAELPRISRREGYAESAICTLLERASAKGSSLAELLWVLLESCGLDIVAYRHKLAKMVDYTSPHYIPHPVVTAAGPALMFLSPGTEGSGSDRVVPVRVRTGNKPLMTAAQAWRQRPNATQIAYFLACFLGALHGICQRDLIEDLAAENDLLPQLRTALRDERNGELSRFLAVTGMDGATYRSAFGDARDSSERSGLRWLFED